MRMQNEAMLRLFVAAPLAPGFDRKFAEVQQRLSAAATRITWVKPGNMHITVKFIGDYPASRLDFLTGLLEETLEGLEPTRLHFRGVTFFPNSRSPRVIKVDTSDESGLLAKSHTRLDEALAAEGVPREDRKFSPHLTLGRIRNTADIPRLVELARAYEDADFGSMDVSSLTLFASKLDRRGPRYTVITEVFCGG